MMHVGTDLLRSFVAVAETLNFTRAGENVHKTQSAVSQQIKRLESDLGVSLFDRKGPHVSLTSKGEAFLPHARRVLKAHDEALSSIAHPDLAGLIKVGFPDELSMCFIPEILSIFARHYPLVQVNVHSDSGQVLLDKVGRGELDLFINTSIHTIPGCEVFARTPLLWVATKSYACCMEPPLPLAMFNPGCTYREYSLRALDKASIPYRIAYSSPSLAGIHGAVSGGMAASALFQASFPPGAISLGEEHGLPPLPMVNIYLVRGRTMNPIADCFWDITREVISQDRTMGPVETG